MHLISEGCLLLNEGWLDEVYKERDSKMNLDKFHMIKKVMMELRSIYVAVKHGVVGNLLEDARDPGAEVGRVDGRPCLCA